MGWALVRSSDHAFSADGRSPLDVDRISKTMQLGKGKTHGLHLLIYFPCCY